MHQTLLDLVKVSGNKVIHCDVSRQPFMQWGEDVHISNPLGRFTSGPNRHVMASN